MSAKQSTLDIQFFFVQFAGEIIGDQQRPWRERRKDQLTFREPLVTTKTAACLANRLFPYTDGGMPLGSLPSFQHTAKVMQSFQP